MFISMLNSMTHYGHKPELVIVAVVVFVVFKYLRGPVDGTETDCVTEERNVLGCDFEEHQFPAARDKAANGLVFKWCRQFDVSCLAIGTLDARIGQ